MIRAVEAHPVFPYYIPLTPSLGHIPQVPALATEKEPRKRLRNEKAKEDQ